MQQIHVSPTGNDQNPGSEEAPLKTLKAARDRVQALIRSAGESPKADITVRLAAGTHQLNETLVLGREDSGGADFSVTWCGSDDGATKLSSGYPLGDWQRCAADLRDLPASVHGRVWYVDLPPGTRVNCLYGDGGSIPRARGKAIRPREIPLEAVTPMPPLYGPDGPIEVSWISKSSGKLGLHDRFGFEEGAISQASDLDEAEFVIIPVMQWTMNILPVGRIDFADKIAYLGENCTYPIGVPACAPDGSIWLENSLSVLRPGTWVFHASKSRLYYCPKSDQPEVDLEAASLTEFIRVEGVHEPQGERHPVVGLKFRNLTFTRSNRYPFHGLTGRGIQHDWEIHDASSCMLRFRHAQRCEVLDCRFTEGGSGGLRMDLDCRDNRVERCEFSDLGGCGVVLCGYGLSRNYLNRNNQVLHNHFFHLGRHYWHSPAIFIWQSGHNHIADNYLHDLPYTAIVCSGRTIYDREGRGECSASIDWQAVEEQCGKGYKHNAWHYGGLPSWWMREPLMHSRDNLIEYNRIHDVMQVMGDGNGIYISGAGGGNVVRFNAVGPCPSTTMAEGIRCDDDQHHTILHGNLIFGMHGHATGITLKGVNRVTNNILALPLKKPDRGMLSLETGPLNGSVIQRNIILTSSPDHRFVGQIRIHGQGRKARLCDTDSDRNIYFCTTAPDAGRNWLDELQSFGIDLQSSCNDPGFMDAENADFNLHPNAAALQVGFQPLPLERMMQTHQRAT